MKIDKQLYRLIEDEINNFNDLTNGFHDVEFGDVIYSYLYSTDETLHVLYDWDEGENNDPYWDKENNRHSTESFFIKMNEIIKANNERNMPSM